MLFKKIFVYNLSLILNTTILKIKFGDGTMYEDESWEYITQFSDRLSQLRANKGVSARDMSLSLGQNPGYINHIENRQNLPSLIGFFNICDYFRITPRQFFETDNIDPQQIASIVTDLKKLSPKQLLYLAPLIHDLVRK